MLKRKFIDKAFYILCIALAMVPTFFLFAMLFSITSNAYYSIWQTKLIVDFDQARITRLDSRYEIRKKLVEYLIQESNQASEKLKIDTALKFFSDYAVHEAIWAASNNQKSAWLTLSGDVDIVFKYHIKDSEFSNCLKHLNDRSLIKKFFNFKLFTNGDSRDSTQAGVLGALIGFFYTACVALIASVPIGILAAIFLEEFMQNSKFANFFEVSISNLSSTPPIIFGILGVAFYIDFLGIPRSSALVGGLTLAFMMLPMIIISVRHSIKNVPPAIKQAALALGASDMQVIMHHTLPISLPGIVTGAILGVARILGESAPLLMIGMVAFVGNIPTSFTDPATVFAVQTYIWATSPDVAFIEKTSMIILVLLGILLVLNSIAYFIKKKFYIEFY